MHTESLFRVIDYKTGSIPSAHKMAAGLALQLPLYAMAVERALADENARPVDAGYWALRGKGYKPLFSQEVDRAGPESRHQETPGHPSRSGRRLRAGSGRPPPTRDVPGPPAPDVADCERTCDYRTVCRLRQVRFTRKPWPEAPTMDDPSPGARTMSRRPATPEQQRALDAVVSVALSSGAGCGKTSVLTDRFLRALRSASRWTASSPSPSPRRPPPRCAAGSAPRAATGRRRRRRTRPLAADAPRPGGGSNRHVPRLLPGSCCAHAVQAGLPPEFELLDEAVAPTLRDDALRSAIRRWLADGHPDLIALAVELGLDAVRDGLRSLLRGRALADPARWADLGPRT